MPDARNRAAVVLDYHARTKHHLHRFAASLGFLDWATQPDPFRTFDGAQGFDLPLSAARLAPVHYNDLYAPGDGGGAASPVNRDSVGALFQLALGLSAWKQYEQTRWALRCNPSSGNLHPTEGYAILPDVQGLDAGVYHYLSSAHRMELRCKPRSEDAGRLVHLLQGAFLVGLSSIHWREAWKYGERAFRYCQHDIGHALATVRYAAAALGWKARLLDVSDETVSDVLGLGRAEDFSGVDEADREHPAALLLVGPESASGKKQLPAVEIAEVRDLVKSGAWAGRANVLSPDHTQWPIIDDVARAAWRSEADVSVDAPFEGMREIAKLAFQGKHPNEAAQPLARDLIQQRRSAVAFDDSMSISAQTFFGMLDRLLPRSHAAPWDVLPWPPHLHCGIFVHRVDGLPPGLYFLVRNPDSQARVLSHLDPGFLFERPEGCPEHVLLFRLKHGDFRQQSQVISCRQKIAGTGAFSLGMVAEFGDGIRSIGSWWYRRLFWESGVLGHVLYLEAEAAGVRGTGIGCYFDDAFHAVLGLRDDRLQSLYHFTVGGPVDDTRLATLPAYAHLGARSP